MENNISRIGNAYFKPEFQVKEDAKRQENNAAKNESKEEKEKKQVDSNEVLGYLAAQNLDIVPTKKAEKTVEVGKYVSSEQEARIEEFMKNFEADFDEAFDIAAEEFPGISDEAAASLALSYINASY